MDELIKVTQLPVIEERLLDVKAQWEQAIQRVQAAQDGSGKRGHRADYNNGGLDTWTLIKYLTGIITLCDRLKDALGKEDGKDDSF